MFPYRIQEFVGFYKIILHQPISSYEKNFKTDMVYIPLCKIKKSIDDLLWIHYDELTEKLPENYYLSWKNFTPALKRQYWQLSPTIMTNFHAEYRKKSQSGFGGY